MFKRSLLVAVLAVLIAAAAAQAALPGAPTLVIGSAKTCHTISSGTRPGATHYCDYSGTVFHLNGWHLATGSCAVVGLMPGSESTFKAKMSGRGGFEVNYGLSAPTGPIQFGVTCPLSWTGSVGLVSSYRITGGVSSFPVYTLHVSNTTRAKRVVACHVRYLNNLHQIRPFTWTRTLAAHTAGRTTIRVWRVRSMTCTYTLTRTLTGDGSA